MSSSAIWRNSAATWSTLGFVCIVTASVVVTFAAVDIPEAIPGAGLALLVMIVARLDWRERRIPDWATLATGLLAIVVATTGEDRLDTMIQSLLRCAAVFVAFLLFRVAFQFWRQRQGMGVGDVKLAGVLGLWLDWPYIPIALEMACLSALIYVLGHKVASGAPFDRMAKIPFGAFLAPAIWVTWLCQRLLS